MRVVREWARPTLWSLDIDLALEHPDLYRYATKVVIEKDADGVCRFCSSPKGPNSEVGRHAARRAREAARARKPA